ncbi:MAG TPA: phosphatase PAP2 family protein [Phycisphaerae bacterium]|nr:phosphatase PAP2 family protein [Phycisphaerae bacterium]
MRRTTLLLATIGTVSVLCGAARAGDGALGEALARYERSDAARGPAAAAPAPSGANTWLTLAAGNADKAPASDKALEKTYVDWRTRRGPAYPGDFWRSLGRWGKEMPATLWDDTKAVATNPWSLAGIAAAGVTGIVLNASGSDNRVADHYTKHGHQLNKFWDNVGDVGGNPGTHFAVAGAMMLSSLAANDAKNYEKSRTLINALAINGLTTMALKGITRTRSPNGDPLGWPSGHTSSSFCFATVIWEEYGPLYGAPLMGFAAFVGYERIDARNHDFSDVVSGALLGMAIGHAIAQNNKHKFLGMDVVPVVNDEIAVGIGLSKRW